MWRGSGTSSGQARGAVGRAAARGGLTAARTALNVSAFTSFASWPSCLTTPCTYVTTLFLRDATSRGGAGGRPGRCQYCRHCLGQASTGAAAPGVSRRTSSPCAPATAGLLAGAEELTGSGGAASWPAGCSSLMAVCVARGAVRSGRERGAQAAAAETHLRRVASLSRPPRWQVHVTSRRARRAPLRRADGVRRRQGPAALPAAGRRDGAARPSGGILLCAPPCRVPNSSRG